MNRYSQGATLWKIFDGDTYLGLITCTNQKDAVSAFAIRNNIPESSIQYDRLWAEAIA